MGDAVRRAARFIFGRLMPRRAYRVLKGPLKGTRIVLGSLAGEGGGASVYFGEMEPEQLEAFANAVRPGSVVFDVGANVGVYTVLASRSAGEGGRVVAFEPVPENLEFLARHIDLNRAENVTVVSAAAAAESGTAKFATGPNRAMGHLETEKGELTVETITLDEAAKRTGTCPDVIKIDVEGGEMDVFRGAHATIARSKPVIFLSTHSDELRAECLDHLTALGYSVRPLIDGDDVHEFVAEHNDYEI